MEPNKTEKQFRDKLNTREIEPSPQAWDRLNAILSVGEGKKTRRPFGFLFIAASILVLISLSVFFFTQNDSEIKISKSIVGKERNQDTVQKEAVKIYEPKVEKDQKNPLVINQFQSSTEPKMNSLKESGKNQKTNDNQNQINKDKEIEFMLTSDVAVKDLPRISNTEGMLISTVKSNNRSDETLVADLDKAARQSADQKTAVKVDAKKLLTQAEGEVDYSFREKIINKVNKNYQQVKVALANRNRE